jgi:hypothetical protein
MLVSGILFVAQLWEHSLLSFALASHGLATDQTRDANLLFSCFLMGNLVLTLVTIGLLDHVWSKLDKKKGPNNPTQPTSQGSEVDR